MNNQYRKTLPDTQLEYFDVRQAVEDIQPGAYDQLPYTSKVLAEQLVRRCEPEILTESLQQLIERLQTRDFPWYPARVVCHDILGQTALVDLAGLRDAIAEQGGDPAKVNPVVPTQLIVDHSLAVEYGGFDPDAFEKIALLKTAVMKTGFILLTGLKLHLKMLMSFPPETALCTRLTLKKCHQWFRSEMVLHFQIPASEQIRIPPIPMRWA